MPLPPQDGVQWRGSLVVGLTDGEEDSSESVEGEEMGGEDKEEGGENENEGVKAERTEEVEEVEEVQKVHDTDIVYDWDDIALSLAAELVKSIRDEVRSKLKYTCSAGIASNKMLSKLASGYKKPNNQTAVLPRAVPAFLAKFKVAKSPSPYPFPHPPINPSPQATR